MARESMKKVVKKPAKKVVLVEVAAYADGVIVGSAFINALMAADSLDSGIKDVRTLVEQLALGVREGRA